MDFEISLWLSCSKDFRGLNQLLSQFSSVIQSYPTLCNPMDRSTPGLPVHHQLSGVYPNSRSLSQWWHPTISSSVILFSSCLQSFQASGSFQMSQFFASGGQSIRVSASASFLPMNAQDWSALGWTGRIFLQSKGLLRVFSNTTVQKHQFFVDQLYLWSSSHIHTWLLEKPPSWVRKIPGEGHGNPLSYSCLENPMDRGAWQATVHRVTQSQFLVSFFWCT